MKTIFGKKQTTTGNNGHSNVHHPNKYMFNCDLKGTGIVATIDKEHPGTNNANGSKMLKPVKKLIEKPVNKLFVKMPWVAGEYAEDAVKRALELNRAGSPAIICCLGEHMSSRQDVENMVVEYHGLIDLIAQKGANASLAVRPSPFGSDVPDSDRHEFCVSNLESLTSHAKAKGVFVWIDMESHEYVDFTLQVYVYLQKKYGNVGVALEANMRRSEDDLRMLISHPDLQENLPVVRLIKGIYSEKPEVAFTDYGENHANFTRLIKVAFEESKPGSTIVVGTHHEGRFLDSLVFSDAHPEMKLELQILKGIKTPLADQLRELGYIVTEYVPYGKKCFAYCARRAAKSPSFMEMTAQQPIPGMPKWISKIATPNRIMKVYNLLTDHDLNTAAARGSADDAAALKMHLEVKHSRGVQF